jgi:predicted DNA-binding transcriptional regulator AlpA
MPDLLILIFVCHLIYLYITMKKPTKTTEKPAPKAKAEQPAATVASEIKAIKASPSPKPTAKPKAVIPKPVAKVKAEQPVAVAATDTKAVKPSQTPKSPNKAKVVAVAETAELPVSERVGLTAGSIWQYLSDNGSTSVAKLVRDLPEEEKIIQRSIGWLAQEGKIILDTIDRVETIGLTE